MGLDFTPLWEVGNSNVHTKTGQEQDTHAGRPPARAIGHSGDAGRTPAGTIEHSGDVGRPPAGGISRDQARLSSASSLFTLDS